MQGNGAFIKMLDSSQEKNKYFNENILQIKGKAQT